MKEWIEQLNTGYHNLNNNINIIIKISKIWKLL